MYQDRADVNRGRKSVCSDECSSVLRRRPRNQITKPCIICETPITRAVSHMKGNVCCSRKCTTQYISQKLSALNRELNPDRMIPTTREKLREARLSMGLGEGKAYRKTYSRHTHRIVAEEILGRPLKKGEVVHHIDENKLNNAPSNIQIFASQAEHARHHALKKPINPKTKRP